MAAYNRHNMPLALALYRMAADQGDARAAADLGTMYQDGLGVAKDSLEATKWYRKAASQGDAYGQLLLGTAYYKGEGVPKDVQAAYFWYTLSAAQKDKPAAAVALQNLEVVRPELTQERRSQAERAAEIQLAKVDAEKGRVLAEAYVKQQQELEKKREEERQKAERHREWLASPEYKKQQAELEIKRQKERREEEIRVDIERKNLSKNFPYYAVVFCGFNGQHTNIMACFSGSVSTELELTNGSSYGLYKVYQLPQLGEETRDGLAINLQNKFSMQAQNSSEDLVLGVKIYKRSTNELVFQKQVARFGVIKVGN